MASWIDSLESRTPLFVPQAGITCELRVEAEHDVPGQFFVFHELRWTGEGEETVGQPGEQ